VGLAGLRRAEVERLNGQALHRGSRERRVGGSSARLLRGAVPFKGLFGQEGPAAEATTNRWQGPRSHRSTGYAEQSTSPRSCGTCSRRTCAPPRAGNAHVTVPAAHHDAREYGTCFLGRTKDQPDGRNQDARRGMHQRRSGYAASTPMPPFSCAYGPAWGQILRRAPRA
jgi:hypothetical protein